MKLPEFKKLMFAKNIPHYAFPRTSKVKDLFNYEIEHFTVERRVLKSIKIKKTTNVIRISSGLQKKVLTSLVDLKIPFAPYTIGISSFPSDLISMEVAGTINYFLLKNNLGMSWNWLNTSLNYYNNKEDLENSNLIVIYNVIDEPSRYQKVRDLITSYPRALKLVVIGGINALDLFDKKLRIPLSGVINFTGASIHKFSPPKELKKKTKITIQDSDLVFTSDIYRLLSSYTKKLKVKK